MSLDIDLVEFVGGERDGQLGVLMDCKFRYFVLYDHNGEFLAEWEIYDVYEDEEAQERDDYIPSGPLAFCHANPFRLVHQDIFSLEALSLICRVGQYLRERTGHRIWCLGDNRREAPPPRPTQNSDDLELWKSDWLSFSVPADDADPA